LRPSWRTRCRARSTTGAASGCHRNPAVDDQRQFTVRSIARP
jgi:hypothetical protein